MKVPQANDVKSFTLVNEESGRAEKHIRDTALMPHIGIVAR